MKKILTIIVLILTIALTTSVALAEGEVAGTGIETNPSQKEEEKPTDIRTKPIQIPLPFSPTETESLRKNIDDSLSEQGTVKKVTVAGQEVPVFAMAYAGMRFIITALFFVAGPITLAVIVYSGVMLVIKADNEEEATKTRRTLIFSAIGLLVMALAYAIVQNIIKIF